MGDIGGSPIETPTGMKVKTVYTFDEIIRQRAVDDDQSPLIAYPKTPLGITDYELFTGRQLDRLVDGAAKALMRAGVQPVYEDTVAGIYGTSDLDYIITIFGLGRLGYTTFILSPRLPVNACVNLLQGAKSSILLHAPQFVDLAARTSQEIPLKLIPILTRGEYDHPDDTSLPFERTGVDGEKETVKKLIMMHSSGSTGLPRPIDYTHKRLLATMLTAQNLIAFQSVPLFHAHGFISFIQAIYKRKTIYLFNGNVPQTHDTVTDAIKAAKPEIVWTVPYVLKLLAEKRDGIEVLKTCKVVSCSGSRCPDELGDLMIKEGIHFGTAFGATEVALILTSLNRPRDDKAWNYLRPPPHVTPFIHMKPVDGAICECVVLDGHKGKMMSNSNDPPNSFHTKDLFIAHPTISNAWKFVGRLDDRVTLTNGEKVLPLPIEGRIQQDALVKEAVVFGVDRPVPGLLIFRAKSAEGLSDEEFLDNVWPAIEDANSRAEGFSQISREMIAVIPEHIDCPTTDKSSIKRAQVYRDFASVINGVYTRLESSAGGSLKLKIPELENWIIESFAELGIQLEDVKTDFFSAGVDSLKAIQMRGLIIKNLDLGGNVSRCTSMIVYDCGTTEKLAKALFAIRTGDGENVEDETATMKVLIEEYSKFEVRVAGQTKEPENNVVILTGATGSLGAHILAQLINLPSISKIYCLLRPTSCTSTALSRLETSLQSRNLSHLTTSPKLLAISCSLSDPDLGLSTPILKELRVETTHIIHCAWAVNFALPLTSFTPHLAALQNLINLSLSSYFSSPPYLLFCSSIGVAVATPSPSPSSPTLHLTTIPEAPISDLSHASATGYARSKLIGEHMLENAVKRSGANATVLRIGQIVPPLGKGGNTLWNVNEMIPLIVRAANSTGALPDVPGGGDGCSWIDVETLASAVRDIASVGVVGDGGNDWEKGGDGDRRKRLVYNLVHPRPFSWREDFLPALKEAGLVFEVKGWEEWLEALERSEVDVGRNPSRKLLGFWKEQKRGEGKREVRFETSAAEEKSEALRNEKPVVAGSYVADLLEAWRGVW